MKLDFHKYMKFETNSITSSVALAVHEGEFYLDTIQLNDESGWLESPQQAGACLTLNDLDELVKVLIEARQYMTRAV